MQLVLSNNRVIAYGESFVVKGESVIDKTTGAEYDNATIAECENYPNDIDTVGYEYHAGVFVPCAPYGMGDNNGYFMEVCADCATPRSSGIPIKGGIKLENLSDEVTGLALGSAQFTLLWENANPSMSYPSGTITISNSSEYDLLIITSKNAATCILAVGTGTMGRTVYGSSSTYHYFRTVTWNIYYNTVEFGSMYGRSVASQNNYSGSGGATYCVPYQIYGVKL